jgi:hypothetical protein
MEGNVARIGERCKYRVLVGKPKRWRTLERPGLDGRILLKCKVSAPWSE